MAKDDTYDSSQWERSISYLKRMKAYEARKATHYKEMQERVAGVQSGARRADRSVRGATMHSGRNAAALGQVIEAYKSKGASGVLAYLRDLRDKQAAEYEGIIDACAAGLELQRHEIEAMLDKYERYALLADFVGESIDLIPTLAASPSQEVKDG